MGIPAKVSAAGAVAKSQIFHGVIAVPALLRLAQVAQAGLAPIKVELAADGRSGYPRLHGNLAGELKLTCQHCGKQFVWTVDASVDLRLVDSDEQGHDLLGECDPYQVLEDVLPLHEVIEDELLLSLPMLARCESCENSVNAAPKPAKIEAPRRENPFAALKDQLKH